VLGFHFIMLFLTEFKRFPQLKGKKHFAVSSHA